MFRKHQLILSGSGTGQGATEGGADLSSGQEVALITLQSSLNVAGSAASVLTAQGQRYFKATGPITVHGYSIQTFGTFFGCVYQGLSRIEDNLVNDDNEVNSAVVHPYPMEVDMNTDPDLWPQVKNIRNLKYLRGWRQDPAGGTFDADTRRNQTVHMGSAKLDKKFTRKQFRSIGRDKYEKIKKSGLVMVPESSTEFMSIVLKNLQTTETSADQGEGLATGSWYARVTMWISWDQT